MRRWWVVGCGLWVVFLMDGCRHALTWLCCAYSPSNTGTGWSGWGNYQSASVNGNQNWAANCDWWCDRQWDVSFPAGQTSTAIFANGMSAPNGCCCGKVRLFCEHCRVQRRCFNP